MISVEAPYNSEWITAIKYCIPLKNRSYVERVWIFDPQFYTAARTITEHFFGSTVIDSTGGVSEPQSNLWKERWSAFKEGKNESRAKAPKQDMSWGDSPFEVLYVTTAAPKEVIQAAYRILCKMTHPDVGGNPEEMKRINEAYDKLKRAGRV